MTKRFMYPRRKSTSNDTIRHIIGSQSKRFATSDVDTDTSNPCGHDVTRKYGVHTSRRAWCLSSSRWMILDGGDDGSKKANPIWTSRRGPHGKTVYVKNSIDATKCAQSWVEDATPKSRNLPFLRGPSCPLLPADAEIAMTGGLCLLDRISVMAFEQGWNRGAGCISSWRLCKGCARQARETAPWSL
jgi:hypothetical protein